MKKLFFLLIIFILGTFKCNAATIELNAPSAILIDQNTGTVLFDKNASEKRPMASMTKIMSLILIMERIDDGTLSYDDEVVISINSSKMGGSQLFLQAGDKYTVKDLLKSVAMASANDSIVALAEKTYGTQEEFVSMMNEKAKELNLKNTHFENVHGLDSNNHYSTAYDMAIMARELLKHEDILKFTSVYEEYLQKPDGSQAWLVNTNKLVRFYDGVDGLKTGYTDKAGYCITATAKKNNLRLISVVMGESSIENRSQDTVKMLNYGFNMYKVNVIKEKNISLGKVKVLKGKVDSVDVVLVNDAIELLKVNEKISEYHFKIDIDKIVAPVYKGNVVGKVTILDGDNNIVSTADVTVKENVLKASFFDILKREFRLITINI